MTNTPPKKRPKTIPYFVIEDTKTMQALANPVRWEILDAVSALGDCSVADIAHFTARARTSIYPHIQQLVDHDLVIEIGTRLMGKRYEQLYRPLATMFGTRFNQTDKDNLDYHATYAKALARLLARKQERSAAEPGVNPRTNQRNHHCGGHSVWVDKKQLAKLNALIDDIWELCKDSRPDENKELMHIGVFLSRHLPKSKNN